MGTKINLDFSIDAIKKESFERGKRAGQKEFNKILNKIRAEIKELKPNNPNFKGYFEQNVALNKALDIIDKYRGEEDGKID